MTSAFESAIGDAMAELEKQRDSLAHLTEELGQISATARSKRRQVSVTVDARGEITELIFHGQGYKNLPPADLARLIVETIQDAKQAAQEQVWDSFGDSMPEGLEFAKATAGVEQWTDALAAMRLPQPLMDLLSAPPEFGDLAQHVELTEVLNLLGVADPNGGGTGTGSGGDGSRPRKD
jgi:DNA-binding protein YbaB